MTKNDTLNLNEACEVCGQSNPTTIETHHVVPQRYGGSDAPANLVNLCGSCHNAIERIYDAAFYRRLHADSALAGEDVDADDLGHSIESQWSPDRDFPPAPVHVTYEGMFPFEIVEFGWTGRDVLRRKGYINEDDEDEEENGTLEDDGDEEATETLEMVEMIHCGYCNTAFLPWEQGDCAKHLQIVHRINDPYETRGSVMEMFE